MTEVTRVQRVPESWPVVHLEAEVPAWAFLAVDGSVAHPRRFALNDLATLGTETREIDFHCVWGWSRPRVRWTGVGLDRLLAVSGVQGSHVTVRSASDDYSACLPVEVAARGFLAWAREGESLGLEAGGPLRFVPPPELWAYKGVKWAQWVTVGHEFAPGFWESRIGDPVGNIPPEVILP
jgi:DMSO/TMAO reductase YedYZ molybdopterin-dependent catalytic subunit